MAMIKLAAHLASVHGFLEMYRLAPHADAFYLTWLFSSSPKELVRPSTS